MRKHEARIVVIIFLFKPMISLVILRLAPDGFILRNEQNFRNIFDSFFSRSFLVSFNKIDWNVGGFRSNEIHLLF